MAIKRIETYCFFVTILICLILKEIIKQIIPNIKMKINNPAAPRDSNESKKKL